MPNKPKMATPYSALVEFPFWWLESRSEKRSGAVRDGAAISQTFCQEMITIQAYKWIRIMRLSPLFSIPAITYLFWQPSWVLGSLATVVAYCVIVGLGLSGAILAFAERLGFVCFQWDAPSKKSLFYRMRCLHESMNPHARMTSNKEGKQDGSGQPATASESKLEGKEKPQPAAEERSR